MLRHTRGSFGCSLPTSDTPTVRESPTFLNGVLRDMGLAAGTDTVARDVVSRFRLAAWDDCTPIGPREKRWKTNEDLGVCEVDTSWNEGKVVAFHDRLIGETTTRWLFLSVSWAPCIPFWRGIALLGHASYALGYLNAEKEVEISASSDRRQYARAIAHVDSLYLVARLLAVPRTDPPPASEAEAGLRTEYGRYADLFRQVGGDYALFVEHVTGYA